ncbi:MAG: PTS sugar transporter subunit IIA [Gemmiger sp.]
MRYLILVAHGEFAPGLHTALNMLVGEREDVLDIPFHDGMTQEAYKDSIRAAIAPIGKEDEVLILADLLGGSPLTGLLEELAAAVGLTSVRAVGGMNLPMAIAATEAEDDPLDVAAATIQNEAAEQIRPFTPEPEEDDSDI